MQTLTQIIQDACLLVANVVVRDRLPREDLRPTEEEEQKENDERNNTTGRVPFETSDINIHVC